MYKNGEGVKQDYFKAAELYQKVCDGGYAEGCFKLGVRYIKGEGVNQNYKKAKELFGKSCDMGYQKGCILAKYLKILLNNS